jgi:hypothetical protein
MDDDDSSLQIFYKLVTGLNIFYAGNEGCANL